MKQAIGFFLESNTTIRRNKIFSAKIKKGWCDNKYLGKYIGNIFYYLFYSDSGRAWMCFLILAVGHPPKREAKSLIVEIGQYYLNVYVS